MRPVRGEGLALVALAAVLSAGGCDSRSDFAINGAAEAAYSNPVVTPVAADPTVIRGEDGRFYLFATNDDWGDGEGLRIIPIFTSPDLLTWSYSGSVFDRLPEWKSEGSLWAPDISRRGGEYRLYYSYSRWDDPNPCIGMAAAAHPLGPWSDAGRVFCSNDIGVRNSIDPFVWHDGEGSTLIWGSFHGIYAVPLAEDGRAAAGEKTRLADNRFEAPYVIRRGDYFYLFVSAGSCCEGARSTYRIYVGRSESLTGPYTDQHDRDLRQGGGMLLLGGNDEWAGPGHNSVITDDAGSYWILYHAIPRGNPMLPSGANRRPALIDRLLWTDAGWPYLEAGIPDTSEKVGPVVSQ